MFQSPHCSLTKPALSLFALLHTNVECHLYDLLQTDVAFLERQINQRKQKFGVEVYELMEQLELDTGMPTEEKETKIRLAFDSARKDIAVIQAKIEVKQEEMAVLENETNAAGGMTMDIPPSDGVVLTNGQPASSSESEYGLQN